MKFPQYRQLSGTQVFYEIYSERQFLEYKKLGGKWLKFEVHASQYPEILRIREMLSEVAPFVKIEQRTFLDTIQ
jgi:hypothetical protein